MPQTVITVQHGAPLDIVQSVSLIGQDALAKQLSLLLSSVGQKDTSAIAFGTRFTGGAGISRAMVTFSGASGTVGVVLNGVSLTFAHVSDNDDAAALQGAIFGSTDPLVQGLYLANPSSGLISFNSAVVGDRVSVGGCVFTAVAQGTTSLRTGEFALGGSNTLDAASLASAIAAHPKISYQANAIADGTAVFLSPFIPGESFTMSTISASMAVTPIETANRCFITTAGVSPFGNLTTVVASGTGVTASGLTLGRMSGGLINNGGGLALY